MEINICCSMLLLLLSAILKQFQIFAWKNKLQAFEINSYTCMKLMQRMDMRNDCHGFDCNNLFLHPFSTTVSYMNRIYFISSYYKFLSHKINVSLGLLILTIDLSTVNSFAAAHRLGHLPWHHRDHRLNPVEA